MKAVRAPLVATKFIAAGPPSASTVEYTWPLRIASVTRLASVSASPVNVVSDNAIENSRNELVYDGKCSEPALS
jgi:hypothetical protein